MTHTTATVEAALRGLDGLCGSDDPADVVALTELAAIVSASFGEENESASLGEIRTRMFVS